MPPPEFAPQQRRTETQLIHILWLTSGLSCDGDTVSMTAATNPSLEDLLTGVIPGMPRIVDLQRAAGLRDRRGLRARVRRRRRGPARPVHPRARGLGAQRADQRRGPLGRLRCRPRDRAADPDHDVDRPPRTAGRLRAGAGHVRRVRRHPGDEEQPDRRDGPARLPRRHLDVAARPAGREPARLPGAARQHHRDAARAGAAPRRRRAGRSTWTSRAAPCGCSAAPRTRAATAQAWPKLGQYSSTHGDGRAS